MKKKFVLASLMLAFIMCIMPNVYAEEAEDVNSWISLKNCLEAEESKTCKVTSDIALGSGDYILIKQAKVLDVQNFTINMSNIIYDYSNLTITGNNGKLVGGPTQDLMMMVANKGTLDIDNVTLQANDNCDGKVCEGQVISISGVDNHVTIGKNATLIGGYGVMFQYHYTGNKEKDKASMKVGANGSVLDVYGTIKASDKGGMGITIKGDITGENHIISDNPPVVNIYDTAKILAKESAAIYGAGYGIWNIKGGHLEGDEALSIKSGVFNITGGTLTAVGKYVENPEPAGGAKETTGAAISITSNKDYDGHIKVNISGNPKIISENGNAIYEGVTDDEKSEVEEINIKGGEFKSAEGLPTVVTSEEFNESHEIGFISGGTFLSGNEKYDVSSYMKNGLVQNADGTVVADSSSVKPENNSKNPNTSDSIIYSVIAIVISALGLTFVLRKLHNN